MSDWDEFDDDEGQQSDLLKDLRKQLKEHKKEREDLATKLAEAETRIRTKTVADVLTAAGVSSKVADLVPADIEATEESVSKWLDNYRDLFGKTEEKPADSEGSREQPSSTVDPEVQAAMTRTAETGAAGEVPNSKVQEQIDQLRKASHEELLQMIANAQQGAAA